METCPTLPPPSLGAQKMDTSPTPSVPTSPPSAFTGNFAPAELSFGYRLGLVVVCCGMALLLAVYVGIIGLTAYGVYYHMSRHSAMLGAGGSGYALFVYLWPALAGAVLVFFMVKPILAGRPEQPPRFSLTPESDPELFALIGRICALTRAPLPSRVDIDCQINASASFRRGLRSLRGNDVVLTIGLPLAAGLTMQEFAGVLAHEFGHFAQGAGMRLTYLIRATSGWFARVVYERDEWDVRLVRAAYGLDLRLGIFLHAVRFIVWLTRRLLWVLMHLGHALSCFMLRQMEYDADSYEVRLAGSEAFARTTTKIQQLSAAGQVALGKLQESWQGRRLPENLPGFIHTCIRNTPPEVLAKVQTAARKTRLLDTHPCDVDRITAAAALKQPGIFHNDRPASALFNDFAGLCRAASRFHYESVFALRITDSNLVSHELAEHDSRTRAEGEQALKDFFFGLQLKYRPLVLPGPAQPELPGLDAAEGVQQARHAMEQSQTAVQQALKEWEQAEQDYQRGLDAVNQQSQQATARAQETMQSLLPILEPFEHQAQTRLAGCLSLLDEPTVVQKLPDAEALRAEAAQLTVVFAHLGAAFGPLQELRRQFSAFTAALNAASREQRRNDRFRQANARLGELDPQLKALIAQIRSTVADVPYPFHHARQDLTLDSFARNDIPASTPVRALCNDCHCHLDRLLPLYQRVLGRLAFIALQVEKQLA